MWSTGKPLRQITRPQKIKPEFRVLYRALGRVFYLTYFYSSSKARFGVLHMGPGGYSADSLKMLSDHINLLGGVDTVHYDKQILYRTYVIINNVMTGFSLIGFCIVIISIILVSNTTRLMIHSKKENIKIFSLLGATNFFIRLPFLLEGIIQGLFGACISVLILFIIKNRQVKVNYI